MPVLLSILCIFGPEILYADLEYPLNKSSQQTYLEIAWSHGSPFLPALGSPIKSRTPLPQADF